MAVKRGNGKSRGMNKGLAKSVKKRRSDSSTEDMTSKDIRTVLAKLARFTFNSIAYTACYFHIIPMNYENGFCSLTTSKLHKFLHYSIWLLAFARVVNIIYICSGLVSEDFSTTTLISVTILIALALAGSLGCCNILRSRETVQLVNSWRQVVWAQEELLHKPVDMFEDVELSIKVAGIGGPAVLVPLIISGIPLVYPELPITMQYQIKQVFPDLPDIWTQLGGFPLEFAFALIAALNATFGACVLVISIDLVNMFGQFMRRLSLNTAAQYHQMTRLYTFYKVYNGILDVLYKVVVPPIFFATSSTIVFALFITFRHTELPIYVYCFYPYMALICFIVQFGCCYDGLNVISATEETVSRLRSRHMKCFRRMSETDRAIGLRWGKTIRPAYFSVGSFTEFNIGVPLGLWDEILNQLLFLLTF